jgi:radical SAM-linked protein
VCDTKTRPSRLRLAENVPPVAPLIRRVLNFAARDQEIHVPGRDAEGRLILPPRRAAPPRIAPELGVKAAWRRVWHTKKGRAAFLSQLELQTMLERAMRRAGLPLSFSQGFHPLPLLSFGRALPVGVHSRAEWFSIALRKDVSADEVHDRLAPCLPDGMEIVRVEPTDRKDCARQAQAELFRIACLGTAREHEDFLQKWREFARLETCTRTWMTKKGERSADLRALVAKLEYDADGAVLCTADWSGGYLSPLVLARAVTGEENILKLAILKLEQFF